MKKVLLLPALIVFMFSTFMYGIELDSVRQIVNFMPKDSIRLAYIAGYINPGKPISLSIPYARFLLEEANKQKNQKYAGKAIFLLLKYYYNSDIDTMQYWLEKSDPVFRQAGMVEELFRTKAWYIYAVTRVGNNQKALNLVKQLKELSVELNYPDGGDMANQALADFYLKNSLKNEGVQLYEEILNGMEQRKAPLTKRVNIVRQLVNLHTNEQKKLKYMEILKGYIDECKIVGIERLDDQNTVAYLEYLYNRSNAAIYINLNQFKEALKYLKSAEAISKEHPEISSENELRQLYCGYYSGIGDLQNALFMYDSLIADFTTQGKTTSVVEMHTKKAFILYKFNHYKESAECYQKLLITKDSLIEATFYKDLADMKAQHETDKLEIRNKEMELEGAHAHTQMLLMGGGIGFLALACCLLGYISYSRHRYGKQLEKAKAKAEEADQMKSAFLANMNHEIRTPLNAIVGFSQIIAEEDEVEVRREYATIIQSNNELLQRLIADVLDISKIESNAMTLNYTEYDIPLLMKEIYSVILLRMPPGVTLLRTDSPNIVFYTDKNRLTQILTNLLTNAIKHTEKGTIRFGCEQKNNDLVFFVEDTGKGIPENQLDNIFSRFVQLSEWTKGVGLGLAICKGLVMKMGGSISVTSELGTGSCFSVTFPIKKA